MNDLRTKIAQQRRRADEPAWLRSGDVFLVAAGILLAVVILLLAGGCGEQMFETLRRALGGGR